ncbi:MAG TPA: alpha/beta hydrolase, partial [Candidatus Limnocylindrales bacterium]|nr:alpha/beta hydrolase [Candidatus Limnocylindrales bacterium]
PGEIDAPAGPGGDESLDSIDPFEPAGEAVSADGTPIALFRLGRALGRPALLVHGSAADHTTWRVAGPLLAADRDVWALDRRGRGASGDTAPYDLEREADDLVAAIEAIRRATGERVDVVGHSFGGRVGLEAARLSASLGRLVVYEGAPPTPDRLADRRRLLRRLETLRRAHVPDVLLGTFLREAVGLTDAELAAYRSSPVWPRRVAAAGTLLRELRADVDRPPRPDSFGRIRIPVLQIVGGASPAPFRVAAAALDGALPEGRLVVIEGARHAAHHSHPEAFVAAVRRFLDAGR